MKVVRPWFLEKDPNTKTSRRAQYNTLTVGDTLTHPDSRTWTPILLFIPNRGSEICPGHSMGRSHTTPLKSTGFHRRVPCQPTTESGPHTPSTNYVLTLLTTPSNEIEVGLDPSLVSNGRVVNTLKTFGELKRLGTFYPPNLFYRINFTDRVSF